MTNVQCSMFNVARAVARASRPWVRPLGLGARNSKKLPSGLSLRVEDMGETPMPRKAAFTLIELLLVLVILGVLAALVVPKFTGTSKRAKETAANTQINGHFKDALAAFEVACGRFPTSDEGLKALIEQPGNIKGWTGPYLDALQVPNDPWGNPYVYRCPGTHRTDTYDLYCTGADGTDSSGENINNWTQK